MTVTTEKNHAGEFLLSEGNGQQSRDTITLAITATDIDPGTILAQKPAGTAVPAVKSGGNTGNGTLTVDATTPVLTGVKQGVYTARCIAAAANSGTFRVEDPDGLVIGDVAVGATFSDDIKFVIADGAVDFVVGDGFDITVTPGNGEFVPYLDSTAATLPARAILYGPALASAAAQKGVGIMRNAEVNAARLTGLTATAKASLARHGILVR